MKKALLLTLVILVMFATSCGGGEPEFVAFTIRMSDYAFEPSNINFPTGVEIRITLENNGSVPHELLIGRNLVAKGYSDDLWERKPSAVEASGTEGFYVGTIEEIASEGFHVELEPGASGTIVFTIPDSQAGVWEMGCFIVDPDGTYHYADGMFGKATVTLPGAQ